MLKGVGKTHGQQAENEADLGFGGLCVLSLLACG